MSNLFLRFSPSTTVSNLTKLLKSKTIRAQLVAAYVYNFVRKMMEKIKQKDVSDTDYQKDITDIIANQLTPKSLTTSAHVAMLLYLILRFALEDQNPLKITNKKTDIKDKLEGLPEKLNEKNREKAGRNIKKLTGIIDKIKNQERLENALDDAVNWLNGKSTQKVEIDKDDERKDNKPISANTAAPEPSSEGPNQRSLPSYLQSKPAQPQETTTTVDSKSETKTKTKPQIKHIPLESPPPKAPPAKKTEDTTTESAEVAASPDAPKSTGGRPNRGLDPLVARRTMPTKKKSSTPQLKPETPTTDTPDVSGVNPQAAQPTTPSTTHQAPASPTTPQAPKAPAAPGTNPPPTGSTAKPPERADLLGEIRKGKKLKDAADRQLADPPKKQEPENFLVDALQDRRLRMREDEDADDGDNEYDDE